MPTYACQCRVCGKEIEYWETIARRNRVPLHCNKKTKRILNAPMVAPMFQEYRAVGIPGAPWVKSKDQHKNLLRQHNKVEIGNDTSMSDTYTDKEFEYLKHEQQKELDTDMAVIAQAEKALAT